MQCHIPHDCNVDTQIQTAQSYIMLHIRMHKNQGIVVYRKMNTYECILYRGEQYIPMHLPEIGYRQVQVMVNECIVLCQEYRTGEGVRST